MKVDSITYFIYTPKNEKLDVKIIKVVDKLDFGYKLETGGSITEHDLKKLVEVDDIADLEPEYYVAFSNGEFRDEIYKHQTLKDQANVTKHLLEPAIKKHRQERNDQIDKLLRIQRRSYNLFKDIKTD